MKKSVVLMSKVEMSNNGECKVEMEVLDSGSSVLVVVRKYHYSNGVSFREGGEHKMQDFPKERMVKATNWGNKFFEQFKGGN